MNVLLSSISIKVDEKIYIKDPETSELGWKIITASIEMMEELGFEAFTFRKLAIEIESTEASVYRYFESKYKLLQYLISWYWGWMEYKLVFMLANIKSPMKRLERAIRLLAEKVDSNTEFTKLNEVKLHHLVISESSKAYLTKFSVEDNLDEQFIGYKKFVDRLSNIVLEINSAYKYPRMLVSTVIEGIHHERYFAEHLPKLTNVIEGEDSISEFYRDMVFKTLGYPNYRGKNGK